MRFPDTNREHFVQAGAAARHYPQASEGIVAVQKPYVILCKIRNWGMDDRQIIVTKCS